jgi:oligopeptide/dipeptide ABC transporter ATP-binding protein
MDEKLLEVKNLRTSFFTVAGEVKAVDNISFYVNKQEVIAIVGESGCGKSVSQMSMVKLIQSPPGKILGGEVIFDGEDIMKYPVNSKELQAIRGAGISFIFQEPMTALNPVYTVGNQLIEVIRKHKKCNKKEAKALAIQALKDVAIPDPERRMNNYPFELSGGMRQRILIAINVACNSKLIIADEPTTALDVTIQAQVMELLQNLVEKNKTSLIIVTHNLGLVTRHTKRIYVMYAGKIIESGTTEEIITNPKHPYTRGLIKSVPNLKDDDNKPLIPIEGTPPSLINLPNACSFMPRCPYACDKCRSSEYPQLRKIDGNEHYIACHLDLEEEIK